MPPFKFFLNFSYIGTRYSGVAEQANQLKTKTVHSEITKSFNSLEKKPSFATQLYISSRTDKGVHALHNTGNVVLDFDVEETNYKFPFDKVQHQKFCDKLKDDLNEILVKNDESIRILKTQIVKPSFVAQREAKARTYLYRLALPNSLHDFSKNDSGFKVPIVQFLSPFELKYVTPINPPFDMDLFEKAIELCTGQHNFSAFTTKQGREQMVKDKKLPIKTLKFDLKIDKSGEFLKNYLPSYYINKYTIIELQITGESFLYKMIRKLVGSMSEVAKGHISLDTLKQMMLCPHEFYEDDANIPVLTQQGLFLKKVHYDPISFEYTEKGYESYVDHLNKELNSVEKMKI